MNHMTGDTKPRALVTGASSGIGLATAEQLATSGAEVIMVSRDPSRGTAAWETVAVLATGPEPVFLAADLSSQASIRDLSARLHLGFDSIDVLINNAGTASRQRELSVGGIEMTFPTNHLAPFLLTHLVFDLLSAAPAARVVTTTSESDGRGHRPLFLPLQGSPQQAGHPQARGRRSPLVDQQTAIPPRPGNQHGINGGDEVKKPARSTNLGPRARRIVVSLARFINPLTLVVAGRRWMPILGVIRHRGRRSGRIYATPLGMRPLGDSFVMPRTFGARSAWFLNVNAAGWCVVTYKGHDYALVEPEVIGYAAAAPAFPRYELLQFRLVGITEYLRMRRAPADWSPPTTITPAVARA